MNLRENKGITFIALTVTVIILLAITGTMVYNSRNQIYMKKIDNLYIDVQTLGSKVDNYYLKYGELPVICQYLTSKSELQTLLNNNANTKGATLNCELNQNDSDEYYVIDLEKLEGLTVNYGYDEQYKNVKNIKAITTSDIEDEIYIINKKTHQIYYPHGIFADSIMYYTY